jgi:hypothetical protein
VHGIGREGRGDPVGVLTGGGVRGRRPDFTAAVSSPARGGHRWWSERPGGAGRRRQRRRCRGVGRGAAGLGPCLYRRGAVAGTPADGGGGLVSRAAPLGPDGLGGSAGWAGR